MMCHVGNLVREQHGVVVIEEQYKIMNRMFWDQNPVIFFFFGGSDENVDSTILCFDFFFNFQYFNLIKFKYQNPTGNRSESLMKVQKPIYSEDKKYGKVLQMMEKVREI